MSAKQKIMLIRILLSAAAAGLLLVFPLEGLWQLLWLIPYLIAGYDVLLGAVHGVVNREVFDEEFLMAIATIGAVILGEYQEGVAVMVFFQTGELFQSIAVGKSRRSIAALMDIRPEVAHLEDENGLSDCSPEAVEPNSLILIRPGERVPLDGIVEEGTSALDTASLTGESLPREIAPGSEVLSGCVNLTGVLRVRTTRPYGESTVARILDLVENSAMKKSRSEAFITRFARVYTPAVCLAAALLAVAPPLAAMAAGHSAQWGVWIYRALSFLVISCPCALVISIPLSFFGGIGGASAKGILIKGGSDLEGLAKAGTVVFDKTGTLTQGKFSVSQLLPAEGVEPSRLLELAALAETHSDHPISRSLREAWGGDPARHTLEEVTEIAGHGVTAKVDGTAVAAGNARLIARLGLSLPEAPSSGTVVYVAQEGKYLGAVCIADLPKDGAKEAVAALRKQEVSPAVMLTGDSPAAAAPVAKALGLDRFYAGLLPQDKVNQVEALLAEKRPGKTLLFVGDGVNDAPVLTRADVGVAMGAMGSDAAIESADVVLMDDDPRKLSLAIAIARKTLTIVQQNIILALGIKALCLVFTAFGITNMWWAIFADVGVMVLAVLNAVRALRAPVSKNL